MDRIQELKKIGDAIAANKKLPLYKYRRENSYLSVPGEGSARAKVMFVGEAPGRNEARTGRPFCGASGKVLDELLAHIGIAREDVFITSVVKDRPPENRDPTPREIAAYAPYLDRQIEIIQPKVITALGRFACKYLMEKFGLEGELKSIGDLHGKVFTAMASYGEVKIVPLYHPAVAVYNGNQKAVLKKDFKVLKNTLDLKGAATMSKKNNARGFRKPTGMEKEAIKSRGDDVRDGMIMGINDALMKTRRLEVVAFLNENGVHKVADLDPKKRKELIGILKKAISGKDWISE